LYRNDIANVEIIDTKRQILGANYHYTDNYYNAERSNAEFHHDAGVAAIGLR